MLSCAVNAPMTPSDCLLTTCHFPAALVIDRHCFPSPQNGAKEALSSSHDNLLTVPRPIRREVLQYPLQDLRHRPWPSPGTHRLGSSLGPHTTGIFHDVAGFASCCGPTSRPSRSSGRFPA